MTKQDEKLRLRRRLQSQAVDFAARNRWQEAVDVNRQMVELGEDTDTFNRLGKAYFELGQLAEARDSYQRALKITPNNPIARKNVDRIEELIARSAVAAAPSKNGRQLVDLRLFITETGKTALTSLIDVPRTPALSQVVTGEKVELRLDGRNVLVYDVDGNLIGRIEPKLAQRLSELMAGGNRYIAAVAQMHGHQVRILIRETYQDPSQRNRISFPGKLGEGAAYVSSLRYEEYEDMADDDDSSDEADAADEEFIGGDEEEELGLEEIDQDMGDDDENIEE